MLKILIEFIRVGKAFKDESGKNVKSITVKVKSWNARKRFYDSRPQKLYK